MHSLTKTRTRGLCEREESLCLGVGEDVTVGALAPTWVCTWGQWGTKDAKDLSSALLEAPDLIVGCATATRSNWAVLIPQLKWDAVLSVLVSCLHCVGITRMSSKHNSSLSIWLSWEKPVISLSSLVAFFIFDSSPVKMVLCQLLHV